MGSTPKKERTKKTPEQRALEALGTAERVYDKAREKVTTLEAELAEARTVVNSPRARLEYVAIHPDLPQEERDRVAAILSPPPVSREEADDPDA